jgi:hypothetical protein
VYSAHCCATADRLCDLMSKPAPPAQVYFYHTETGETTWERPEGYEEPCHHRDEGGEGFEEEGDFSPRLKAIEWGNDGEGGWGGAGDGGVVRKVIRCSSVFPGVFTTPEERTLNGKRNRHWMGCWSPWIFARVA